MSESTNNDAFPKLESQLSCSEYGLGGSCEAMSGTGVSTMMEAVVSTSGTIGLVVLTLHYLSLMTVFFHFLKFISQTLSSLDLSDFCVSSFLDLVSEVFSWEFEESPCEPEPGTSNFEDDSKVVTPSMKTATSTTDWRLFFCSGNGVFSLEIFDGGNLSGDSSVMSRCTDGFGPLCRAYLRIRSDLLVTFESGFIFASAFCFGGTLSWEGSTSSG